GLGFIACAFYFLKMTKKEKSIVRLPIFLGFFLNGLHNLDYPFLRPVAWFAPIGFSLGVIFSIIFAVGLIIMSTEELRRQREESQKITRNLSVLNAIAAIVGQSLNLEKILNGVMDKVTNLIKTEIACILLLDEKNKCLLLATCRGASEEFIQTVKRIQLDKRTSIGRIVHTGKTMHAVDITKEPAVLKEALKKEGMRSFIGIPLKSKNSVSGMMMLAFRNYRPFSPPEIQLLTSIGSTVGVAIENSKLYEKVKDWGKELEKTVAEHTKDLTDSRKATLNILEDINEAYGELKETHVQLVQRERLAAIGQMAAIISHELRNPLTNIKMSAYYLNKKLTKKENSPKVFTGIIQDIEKEIERASGIIANILESSCPPKLVLSPTDVNVVLKESLDSAKEKSWLKNIEIIRKSDTSISKIPLDSSRFKQALDNIILNASQAMPKGGKLIIGTSMVDSRLEIRITDTGIGIVKENFEKIFEPFFSNKPKGIGLGLVVVNEIIRSHRGSIKAESRPGEGSTFVIRLPLTEGRKI
ncbi:MAG: ATP-binding protein, partial [Candidatus Omnitrophota bacterium]|nr:ATP-binding protein [Candidatus Omnitrophota bacterium]